MPRYIDAEHFAERLKVSPAFPNYTNGLFMRDVVLDILGNMPTADVVEVVHGEWIAKGTMIRTPFARNYHCSVCGHEPIEIKNFCPNCGAKMERMDQQ